jgi:septal ring factor EnvC (AmiA/AmiB activator)
MLKCLLTVSLTLGLTLGLGLSPMILWAQDQAQVERRLAQVRARIAELSLQLQANREQRDTALAELGRVETEIGQLGKQIRQLDGRQQELEREGESLAARERGLRADLADQELALAVQLRSAYAFGRQPRLKLILQLDDPGKVDRVLNYYRYYSQARLDVIGAIADRLQELAAVMARQDRLRVNLQRSREELALRRENRQLARQQRQAIVAGIRTAMAGQQRELGSLDQDQQRLADLLEQLTTLLADLPGGFREAPFTQLKGKLNWPANGPLAFAAGQDKPGGMRRDAVVIAAGAGSAVQTVSYGRVAYADWLRGFGLLAIIDHGEGFMSLYGFNEALLVDVGDWVEAGEPIAEVGRSGAQDQDGLYFEIRKDGQPINPTAWFSEPVPDH